MNYAVKQLNFFKEEIDRNFDSFFDIQKKEIRLISPFLKGIVEDIHDLCKKGKRLRAAYIYYSYLACGGNNKKMILDLSMFIEIIHLYFLIHDDIIDEDIIRHGVPTMHIRYQQIYKYRYKKRDPSHFGDSMAIVIGDLAEIFAYKILTSSNLPDKIKNQIISKSNLLVFNTLIGQILDMSLEVRSNIRKFDILDVYKYKTAKYTIEGPLHIGAIAAETKNKKIFDTFSSYAIPLGIAFQIHDDILGIFGKEKRIGKPVCSDVRENKYTLLVWKTFERASSPQKKILKECLGNKNLTEKQINDFRQVVIDTGALDYVKHESNKLLEQSLKAIGKLKLEKSGRDFLVGIAEYLIKREY